MPYARSEASKRIAVEGPPPGPPPAPEVSIIFAIAPTILGAVTYALASS
ncbi:MAG: hypothetical protein QXU69_04495 [Thermofilaceae archaeon]